MKLRGLPWRRWAGVAIPVAVVCLLLALLVPAILRARTEARKIQSRNNLKQIGLGLQNYDEIYECLPSGAFVREDGVALHGWPSRLISLMSANPNYQYIDNSVPWDHDINRYMYCHPEPAYSAPGIDEVSTKDGYPLMHYMGNPTLLHRNSSVTFDDMTDGTAHTWMMGEVADNYQPWGYPFNWRPLGKRLNNGANSYGRPSGDGVYFTMADGSVKWISNDVGESVLTNYADAPPVANADQIAIPPRRFEYSTELWHGDAIDLGENQDEDWWAIAWIDTEKRPDSVVFMGKMKWPPKRALTVDDLRQVADKFPETRILYWGSADDDVAEILPEFENLTDLICAGSLKVTDRGLKAIGRMPALKLLSVYEIRAADLAALQQALPECEIRAEIVSEE